MSAKDPRESGGALKPQLDILPAEQRALWDELAPLRQLGFVLYGGTAIALRLGHRVSVDFDFFSNALLNREQLWDQLPCLRSGTLLQDEYNSITSLVKAGAPNAGAKTVKLSLFGGLQLGRIATPQTTQDGVALVASERDLLATKLKVLLQRAESKDYIDIAALTPHDSDLACGLSGAMALYGSTFQPTEALKALVFFEDGDLESLHQAVRVHLQTAVTRVGHLPAAPAVVPLLAPQLT